MCTYPVVALPRYQAEDSNGVLTATVTNDNANRTTRSPLVSLTRAQCTRRWGCCRIFRAWPSACMHAEAPNVPGAVSVLKMRGRRCHVSTGISHTRGNVWEFCGWILNGAAATAAGGRSGKASETCSRPLRRARARSGVHACRVPCIRRRMRGNELARHGLRGRAHQHSS